MLFKTKELPIIISVGGSLIAPDTGVDTEFLSQLNLLIRKKVAQGKRFMLIAGGGKICRHYQEAARNVIGNINDEDLDWLGIHATRFNAHLLRTIFQDIAHPRIITNYDKKLFNWKEPVAIGAGWKPGWSTDYDAVILARDYKAQLVINLSNINGVYDKDPKKFKDAQLIKKITWEEMEKIIGNKWSPGFNSPFDPVATPLAKKLGLTVIITYGKDLKNIENIIDKESFDGTVVTPYRIDSTFYDRDYYMGKKGGHRVTLTGSFFGRAFHNLVNFIRAVLIIAELAPKKCLDLGCGTGGLIGWLRFFKVEAYGLDFSESAKMLADKGIKQYIKLGDVTNIPFADNSFDLVLSYDLFNHIEQSKIRKVIKESIRVSSKYISHKIYTRENFWLSLTHKQDYSNISHFSLRYWNSIFSSFKELVRVRKRILFPSFFETRYLFKKK